jgi:hypothetical protein
MSGEKSTKLKRLSIPVHIEKKTPTIMLLLSKPGHIILYACCCHFLILEFRDYGEETTRY